MAEGAVLTCSSAPGGDERPRKPGQTPLFHDSFPGAHVGF